MLFNNMSFRMESAFTCFVLFCFLFCFVLFFSNPEGHLFLVFTHWQADALLQSADVSSAELLIQCLGSGQQASWS